MTSVTLFVACERSGCRECARAGTIAAGVLQRGAPRRASIKSIMNNGLEEPAKGEQEQGMRLRVLGCSGGIGQGRRTTAFMVDDDLLIDAGSGVGDLTLEEMGGIRHIFLTHSHLDHIHAMPLLIDSIFDSALQHPITVHALPETIEALRTHIFNWVIWPDFSELPNAAEPVLIFAPMHLGETVEVDGRRLSMLPVNHTVPSVGYVVEAADGACFAFSGDTTCNEGLWQGLNALERLDLLLIEAAFSNSEEPLCEAAHHYCPRMLAADLTKLRHQPPIYLSHAKPGAESLIYEQCQALIPERKLMQLSGGERFTL